MSAVRTHYELLEITPGASAAEIKHAFREQIARYHPDKVAHLGRELQELAASRTAELTEAYRVLSNPASREAYDRSLAAAPPPPPVPTPDAQAADGPQTAEAESAEAGRPAAAAPASSFNQERSRRDELIRRATVNRFRQALVAEYGGAEDPGVRGFEVASVKRSGLFGRDKRPRILGRFVDRVDADVLAETWRQAAACREEDICVFLMGSELAPARELAAATAARQKTASRAQHIVVVPVNARDWQGLVPSSAPPVVRAVLDRLRSGA